MRDAYRHLWERGELPRDRAGKFEAVTSLAIERLRSKRLLVARDDVREAADSKVPPQPIPIRDDGGTTLGDVAV